MGFLHFWTQGKGQLYCLNSALNFIMQDTSWWVILMYRSGSVGAVGGKAWWPNLQLACKNNDMRRKESKGLVVLCDEVNLVSVLAWMWWLVARLIFEIWWWSWVVAVVLEAAKEREVFVMMLSHLINPWWAYAGWRVLEDVFIGTPDAYQIYG